jgi:hypothetical protein
MKSRNSDPSPAANGGPAATSQGKLIKRTQAARMLNVSVSTLRRYEDELHPIIGPKGVRMFDEVTLRSAAITLKRRRVFEAAGPGAGDTAADVFTLLDDGVGATEIVKRLRVAPDLVVALQGQWAEMRGGFVVSKEEAFELGMIARRHPAKTAAGAIADVRRYVNLLKQSKQGSHQCQYCHQQTACSCELCAIDLRGPVVTYGTKVEQRENADGKQEVRVVVDAAWCDDAIDASGSRLATLRSDWQRCEGSPLRRSPTSSKRPSVDADLAGLPHPEGASSLSATPHSNRMRC